MKTYGSNHEKDHELDGGANHIGVEKHHDKKLGWSRIYSVVAAVAVTFLLFFAFATSTQSQQQHSSAALLRTPSYISFLNNEESSDILVSSFLFEKQSQEGLSDIESDGFEVEDSSEFVYGGKYPFVGITYNMNVPGNDLLSRIEQGLLERLNWQYIVLTEDGNLRFPDGRLITDGLSTTTIKWTYDEEDGTLYFHFFFNGRLLKNVRDNMKPRSEGDYSAWDCVGVRFFATFGFTLDQVSSSFDASFTLDQVSSSFDASDRIALQDVMANYAAGLDTKDRERFGNVFTEDVEASFPLIPGGSLKGREEWLDFIWPVINSFSKTQHMVGPQTVTWIDKDTAQTMNSVQAVHFFADNDLRYTIWATYYTTMRRVKSIDGTSRWQISKYRAEILSSDYSKNNSNPP